MTPHFQLRELQGVAKVRVQSRQRRAVSAPMADAMRLPMAACTSIGTDPVALWRAPGDWLVYSITQSAEALLQGLCDVSASPSFWLADVSSASVVLELSGARTLDVLMRECTLDLEGGAIQPGGCAQCEFAQVTVMIHRPRDTEAWRLFVERSVAVHVWDGLSHA